MSVVACWYIHTNHYKGNWNCLDSPGVHNHQSGQRMIHLTISSRKSQSQRRSKSSLTVTRYMIDYRKHTQSLKSVCVWCVTIAHCLLCVCVCYRMCVCVYAHSTSHDCVMFSKGLFSKHKNNSHNC